jgi:hypothetical protein
VTTLPGFEPPDEPTAAERFAASVESSTPAGGGVAVTLDVVGWNDVTMVVLEGEPHPAEGDERVHGRSWEGGSVRDAVPDGVHGEYRSLPGDGDGRYVTVGEVTVRLVIHANELHKATIDGRVRYYVDSRVVRRQPDPAADPRSGDLLERRR